MYRRLISQPKRYFQSGSNIKEIQPKVYQIIQRYVDCTEKQAHTIHFTNPSIKFKVLTDCMNEFNLKINNTDLTHTYTVEDLLQLIARGGSKEILPDFNRVLNTLKRIEATEGQIPSNVLHVFKSAKPNYARSNKKQPILEAQVEQ
ncbi:hypothetical protein BC833DRAFT_596554 [Globomyces pollinis-pini]|nr:hypothetical protein BC833DRAFT_596554 [Globomyces pollinis-pini]